MSLGLLLRRGAEFRECTKFPAGTYFDESIRKAEGLMMQRWQYLCQRILLQQVLKGWAVALFQGFIHLCSV